MRLMWCWSRGMHMPYARPYGDVVRCVTCLMRLTRYHDRHGVQRWRHHPRGRF